MKAQAIGHEQFGLRPGDNQTDFRLAGGKFCSSVGPHNDVQVQHKAGTEDWLSPFFPTGMKNREQRRGLSLDYHPKDLSMAINK